MLGIDAFLDAVATLLADPEHGVAELSPDNVLVWRHGESDPEEDIRRAIQACKGVSVLVLDQGGNSDPSDAAAPVILSETWVELYIDPVRQNRRKHPGVRLPGEIRDDIMRTVHASPLLMDPEDHSMFEAGVRGYQPVADPEYVVFRIRIERPIYL